MGLQWFVMRDLKRANANMPAFKELREMNVEVFTPTKEKITIVRGRKIRKEVPVIQDLLFVYAEREELDPIVEQIPTLQYRYVKGGAYKEAMVVSTEAMERFIYALSVRANPKFFTPEELTPAMYGRTVKIVGSDLNGYEGKLLKLKGSRKKRLMIDIPGVTAAVEVNPDYIQFVD